MIEVLAVLLGIGGAIGVARNETRAAGFGAWVIGNFLWVQHGITTGDLWLAGLFLAYEATAIYGLVSTWTALDWMRYGADRCDL